MKRIIVWVASTFAALVLLFSYHTSTSSVVSTASTQEDTTTGTSSSSASSSGGGTDPTSSGSTVASSTSTTYTGSAIQTRYGPVQVQITVVNGKITDVSVLQYPSSDAKDAQINNRAIPILIQETISAQSASIDSVSGATFTSMGYESSLQSALDQVGTQ
jgi:uncharacterized protein with FMN-binding domain